MKTIAFHHKSLKGLATPIKVFDLERHFLQFPSQSSSTSPPWLTRWENGSGLQWSLKLILLLQKKFIFDVKGGGRYGGSEEMADSHGGFGCEGRQWTRLWLHCVQVTFIVYTFHCVYLPSCTGNFHCFQLTFIVYR